jgi:hypothetical protein
VVITASIVASAGASMPAPLAIPPAVHPSPPRAACLLRVSVVMIAVAASSPPVPLRASTARSMPDRSFGRSSCSPINPVEHTTTSLAPRPSRSATRSAEAWVFWNPSGPV